MLALPDDEGRGMLSPVFVTAAVLAVKGTVCETGTGGGFGSARTIEYRDEARRCLMIVGMNGGRSEKLPGGHPEVSSIGTSGMVWFGVEV